MINFLMNYIPQYRENMTKEKEKYKKTDTGDNRKFYDSVTLLKLTKSKNCVKLLHMSIKKIKYVDTDKMIAQFHLGYMSMPF